MEATGSNPSITSGPAPDHPPPIPTYGNKWVQRVYAAVFTENLPGEGVQFRANGFNTPGVYFVDKVQVWKLPSPTGGNVGLDSGFYQGNSTDLGVDTVNVQDFGTATSLPGVTFKVPIGHAKEVNNTVTDILFDAKDIAITNGSTFKSSFVGHLHCWVKI